MATNTELFKQQDERIRALERNNKTLKRFYFLFIFITLLLAAYIVYVELEEPPFGKWRYIKEEKLQTEQFNDYLLSRIDSINRANDLLMENSPLYNGVFFEVQIGAFQYFNLNAYQESLEKLHSYEEDSLSKYVLGKFRSYTMAQNFRTDIARMGVKDAFIIGKIDGKRVPIQKALAASKKKKW